MKKLDGGQLHFLRLIASGERCAENGWASVSRAIYPLVQEMPTELVELVELSQTEDGGGRVRLTAHGRAIIDAMDWIC